LANAKARSWFRPLGGLNQPSTFEASRVSRAKPTCSI